MFSKPAPRKFQLGLELDTDHNVRIVTVVSTELFTASLKEGMKLDPGILVIHNPETPVRLAGLDRMASVNGFTIIYKNPAMLNLGGLSEALLAIEPWYAFKDNTLSSPPHSSSRCTLGDLVALVRKHLLPKLAAEQPAQEAAVGGDK